MPKRKRQPDDFDVAEFLRESDDDLKSALHSLLRTPEAGANLALEAKLNPPVNLDKPGRSPSHDDALKSGAPINLIGTSKLRAGSDLQTPSISKAPFNLAPPKRRFAIREMHCPSDAHTRAEQHVYERLWEIAQPYDEISRAVTIGFGAMANLVGLSESNARINLRSLLAKLAVEEIGEYNCERSQGRTYRIFNETEILRRRREAGLRWYMRRTLAVVFVDPATGQPLLKSKPLRRQGPVLS
jgi:hypothetical protein